ncbi:ssl1498 family light-harvesting-like protein [Oscillatoria sp. FACHB-1406]|uniref:photosystem II assembly protein Psb34 n=1 Tax=Oscillatoria sp. FACHB-1406 TaxID=2692846 RepID=UPI001684BC41|nr:ssl1498 family light-harvesting-like protein [Oscillatoria sp. FACHB-1406]MBD2578740.1 ssl1498 family light-harvesting-like protein [Oscillatoria sp. FACHB-1406]
MPYTEEDGGRLNNFAIEPKMYQAKASSKTEQRNTLILGAVGLVLVGGLIAVAFLASAGS